MLKSVLIVSAVLFGVASPAVHLSEDVTSVAEHVSLNLPPADTVIAQLSYLEIRHDVEGFSLSVIDKTAVFVDFEFPGNLHIRIGF